MGRNRFTSVRVGNPWHQYLYAIAAKKEKKNPKHFSLTCRMCPLHVESTTGQYYRIRELNLQGGSSCFPTLGRTEKKKKKCFLMQSVPTALAESASFTSQNRSLS